MCTNYWLGGIICCRSAPKEEKWKRAKAAKNWIAISALLWDFSLLFLTIKKAWDYWIRNVDILLLKLSTVRSQNSSWCSRCPSFFNKGQKWWALRVKECFISLLGQQPEETLRLLLSSPRIPPVFAAPKLATKCCSQVKKALQQLRQKRAEKRRTLRCARFILDYTVVLVPIFGNWRGPIFVADLFNWWYTFFSDIMYLVKITTIF